VDENDNENSSSWNDPIMAQMFRVWAVGSRVSEDDVRIWLKRARYVSFFQLITRGSFAALVTVAGGLGFLAFRLPKESFFQLLCIELSAGIATFLISPLVVGLSVKWNWGGRLSVLAVSIACSFLAYTKEGAERGFLIEAAVALGLLVFLELLFRRWMKKVKQAYLNKMQEFQTEAQGAAADEAADRDDVLPVTGHGWGALDQYETPSDNAKKEPGPENLKNTENEPHGQDNN
jgi:hypothetical protein